MAREKRLQLPFESTEISTLFYGHEKCSAWLFPLFNFDFSIIFPPSDNLSNYFEPSSKRNFTNEDVNLLRNAILATPRPAYIRGIVDSFIEEVMKTPHYVAIHWTFNDKDWTYKCENPHEADQHLLEWYSLENIHSHGPYLDNIFQLSTFFNCNIFHLSR